MKDVESDINKKEKALKKSKNSLKDKFCFLWKDERSYKKRLLLSAIISFAFCFTFLFFGPLELTTFGESSLTFSASSIVPIMSVFALIIFVLLTFLLSFLKGKVFDYCITAVFAILLCGYIQGLVLNGDLGALNGDTILWHNSKGKMLLNLLIWLVIFIASYLVLYLKRDVWLKIAKYVSLALVVMQSVAMIGFVTGISHNSAQKTDEFLTTKDLVTYSEKDNTFIFILDRFDYDYVEDILAEDPNFFDRLDGFTSYTNAIAEHARTKPALNFMFTNCADGLWTKPAEEHFEDSWDYKGRNILKDLKEADYNIDLYTEYGNLFGNGDTAEKYVSNLSSNYSINVMTVIRNLTNLSAYRYAPTTLKPFFWCYTDDINKDIYKDNVAYEIDETKYDGNLSNTKLEKNSKFFKFYHFLGPHEPCTINEEGIKTSNRTSPVEQTKGGFSILLRAFDKMKELGIYKDASIIITADHGHPVCDAKPLQKATRIGLFYKPSGCADIPLQYSNAPVSHTNIPATIAKSAGIEDYKKFGKPLDEVAEDEDVVRTFYKSVKIDGHEVQFRVYELIGDASVFENWKFKEIYDAEYEYY